MKKLKTVARSLNDLPQALNETESSKRKRELEQFHENYLSELEAFNIHRAAFRNDAPREAFFNTDKGLMDSRPVSLYEAVDIIKSAAFRNEPPANHPLRFRK